MKKLLSLLSVLTISGTALPTTIAASPYQKEETILKRNKRWGEVQWIQIAQQWRNAELSYQQAAINFQYSQNHAAFAQAQQRFLQAQQAFVNSQNEWQQGLTQWANEIRNERNQQWWNNSNTKQAHEAEKQWVYNKFDQFGNKIGAQVNRNNIDRTLQYKLSNNINKRETYTECLRKTSEAAAGAGLGVAVASWFLGVPFLGALIGAAGALGGTIFGLVGCAI